MEARNRESILSKTHYGIDIYAHILRLYYPGQTVLSLSGRTCPPTKNPFNADKPTLNIFIEKSSKQELSSSSLVTMPSAANFAQSEKENVLGNASDKELARHSDSQNAIHAGDAFDFAELHYKKSGEELLQTLNIEMNLHIGEKFDFYANRNKIDYPQQALQTPLSPSPHGEGSGVRCFSFFKSPIKNTVPHKSATLLQIYNAITGDYYKERTDKLRSIADPKQARQFKANNFDYCTFSGTFTSRNDKNLLQHSGLLAVDFDHLTKTPFSFGRGVGGEVEEVRQALLADDYFDTQLLFVSPSGDGLKWIIPIDTSKTPHSEYFAAVANYIFKPTALRLTSQGGIFPEPVFYHTTQMHLSTQITYNNMSKKTFNPADWTETNKTESKATTSNKPVQSTTLSPSQKPNSDFLSPQGESTRRGIEVIEGSGVRSESDIETITQRVESSAVDIAPNYADWRDLGFALAEELGESGRAYYHRLSRFYQNYNSTEADKQFDACLKAHGHGVSIKTFYHLAKAAGINVGIPKVKESKPNSKVEEKAEIEDMSDTELSPSPNGEGSGVRCFPSEIFDQLPDLLRRITTKGTSPEDKDILLLGSLVSMSSCLPNIYGVYAEREVFANLFLFVTAQASAGKGRLTLCRKLVDPIHKALREQNKAEFEIYQRELTEYAAAKGDKVNMEKPQEPPLKMLVIPANNSATGLFQILNDNNGKGLIFETEGDTLALTFKSEHGNYSDGFRKAFHHETITYNRRKDREFVEIDMPRLSALLSGTPRQVSTLIPNAENGLFSRFIFYFMNIRHEWKDVFAGESGQTLDHYFDQLGDQFHELYKCLQSQVKPMRFCLTVSQQKQFNSYFEQTQIQYIELCGEDYIGTVRRLGLITFRIAMILTTLRIMDNGELRSPLVCSDPDFNIAMEMVKVLVQHAAHVFQQLPTDAATKVQPNQKQQFLNMLPSEFDRQTYLSVADKLKIPAKTAEKQIARFAKTGLINHFAQNQYRK